MYPTLFTTPGVRQFAEDVDAERQRQITKFGDQRHPDGTGLPVYRHSANRYRDHADHAAASGHLAWRDVLLEEVYEALAESDPAKLRAELIQVAAVCAAWVSDIDRRTPPAASDDEVRAVAPVPGRPARLTANTVTDDDLDALKAEMQRLRRQLAGQGTALRNVTAERDRARTIAVALEQQNAHAAELLDQVPNEVLPGVPGHDHQSVLRALATLRGDSVATTLLPTSTPETDQ